MPNLKSFDREVDELVKVSKILREESEELAKEFTKVSAKLRVLEKAAMELAELHERKRNGFAVRSPLV